MLLHVELRKPKDLCKINGNSKIARRPRYVTWPGGTRGTRYSGKKYRFLHTSLLEIFAQKQKSREKVRRHAYQLNRHCFDNLAVNCQIPFGFELGQEKICEKKTYKVSFVLKGIVKVGDPPAIAEHEDVTFLLKACRLRAFEHLPLVQDLERVDPVGLAHLDDADLAEGPSTDHLQDLEVIFAQPQVSYFVCYWFHCKRKGKIKQK